MISVKLFPLVLTALDICAAVVYACHGDVRHSIYWLSAAALTLCVTL
jgi:hypothetical protein